MDNTKVTALKEQRAAFKANLKSAADQERYTLKLHDTDVIFAKDSLEEFIRLIQRQGINNLTIYSVGELLSGNKYQTVSVRYPPPNWPEDQEIPNEFDIRELKDRKNYFVFVRYSFCWEAGGEERENDFFLSNNEKNGRHVFVKTVNDIVFYKTYLLDDNGYKVLDENGNPVLDTTKSSIFHEAFSDENPLPDIFQENIEYNDKNGTFTVTVDNIQYVIKIRGFNDDGEYIGKMKIDPDGEELGSDGQSLADNTDGYVLRGDGVWANSIDNDWLPTDSNLHDLGSNTQQWRNLYLSGTAYTGDILANEPNMYDIGSENDRWDTIYANTGDFNALTLNGQDVDLSSLPIVPSSSRMFWRGDGIWSNELTGDLSIKSDLDARRYTYNDYIYSSQNSSDLESDGILTQVETGNFIYNQNTTENNTIYFNGYIQTYPYYSSGSGQYVSGGSSATVSTSGTPMTKTMKRIILGPTSGVSIDKDTGTVTGEYSNQQLISTNTKISIYYVIFVSTYESTSFHNGSWSGYSTTKKEYYGLEKHSTVNLNLDNLTNINTQLQRFYAQILTTDQNGNNASYNTRQMQLSNYSSISNSPEFIEENTPNPDYVTVRYKFLSDSPLYFYTESEGNTNYNPCIQNELYPLTSYFFLRSAGIENDDPAVGLGYDSAMVEGSIHTLGGISARKSIKGYKVYAAVFNDYAECRKTINLEAGRVVVDNDDGTLACASQRLQPGAQVISDTYGHLIGEMPGSETPLAVSGRVLVYTYQPRENYHAGMAVCSAPDGTVDIMTREEIKEYPDCIIGIVSEIPQYEKWGSDQVNVDGRIWIKVK